MTASAVQTYQLLFTDGPGKSSIWQTEVLIT